MLARVRRIGIGSQDFVTNEQQGILRLVIA